LTSDRPRNERRRSSYMDSDRDKDRDRSKRHSSKRHSTTLPFRDRPRDEPTKSRRLSTNREEPMMNGKPGPSEPKAEPYLASGSDKISSWVHSQSADPPLPLGPEETATVVEPPPGAPGGGPSDDERRGERRRRRRERARDTKMSDEDDYSGERRRTRRSPDQYATRPEPSKRTSWLKKFTGRT
jgi:hypothetical protein